MHRVGGGLFGSMGLGLFRIVQPIFILVVLQYNVDERHTSCSRQREGTEGGHTHAGRIYSGSTHSVDTFVAWERGSVGSR